MDKRKAAKITGWSLVIMALVAAFSIGYAYQALYAPGNITSFEDNIGLNKLMLAGILVILVLDIIVSYSLFHYFKNDGRKLSIASSYLRIIYTMVFALAAFYLLQNLNFSETDRELINENAQYFQSIWSTGLIIFGVHIILVGMLMKLHNRIPKILWYLTLLAGLSYILVHMLKLIPAQSEIAGNLEMILALPMAVGELGLAIWLIVKGGKVNTKSAMTHA